MRTLLLVGPLMLAFSGAFQPLLAEELLSIAQGPSDEGDPALEARSHGVVEGKVEPGGDGSLRLLLPTPEGQWTFLTSLEPTLDFGSCLAQSKPDIVNSRAGKSLAKRFWLFPDTRPALLLELSSRRVLWSYDAENTCWKRRPVDPIRMLPDERVSLLSEKLLLEEDAVYDWMDASHSFKLSDVDGLGAMKLVVKSGKAKLKSSTGETLAKVELTSSSEEFGYENEMVLELALETTSGGTRVLSLRYNVDALIGDGGTSQSDLKMMWSIEGAKLIPFAKHQTRDSSWNDLPGGGSAFLSSGFYPLDGGTLEYTTSRRTSWEPEETHLLRDQEVCWTTVDRYRTDVDEEVALRLGDTKVRLSTVSDSSIRFVEHDEPVYGDECSTVEDSDALAKAGADLRKIWPRQGRWIYAVHRSADGSEDDMAAELRYYLEWRIKKVETEADGRLLIHLEERGGPAERAVRKHKMRITQQCVERLDKENTVVASACFGKHIYAKRTGVLTPMFTEAMRGVQIKPGVGLAAWDDYTSKREVLLELVGYELGEEKSGLTDLDIRSCDWNASKKAKKKLTLKLAGSHGMKKVVITSKGGYKAHLTGSSEHTVERPEEGYTLVRAKNWLDWTTGVEHVLLHFKTTKGLEAVVIQIDGEKITEHSIVFDRPSPKGRFSTLLTARSDTCMVQIVWRPKDSQTQIANYDLSGPEPKRLEGGDLE